VKTQSRNKRTYCWENPLWLTGLDAFITKKYISKCLKILKIYLDKTKLLAINLDLVARGVAHGYLHWWRKSSCFGGYQITNSAITGIHLASIGSSCSPFSFLWSSENLLLLDVIGC
jgi:hypothetical protein